MRTCPKCGTTANAKFCPDCGNPMSPESSGPIGSQEAPMFTPKEEPSQQGYSQQQYNQQPQHREPPRYVKPKKPFYKRWWFIIIIVVLILIVVTSILGGGSPFEDAAKTTAEMEFKASDYEKTAYDDLARNPDKYEKSLVMGKGTVAQVIDDRNETQLRVAVGGNYDKMILLAYDPAIIKGRVLEDDTITYYGQSVGLITYDSTLGGEVTIPGIYATKIKIK